MQLSLYDERFIVEGTFHLIERRKIIQWLKGCDAHLYRSFERGSDEIKYVFAGEMTPHTVFSEAARRGVTILDEEALLDVLRVEWSVDDRLVALRSLLNQPPAEQVWQQICQELELWPAEAGLEIGLSYVQGATRSWPAAPLMRSPQRWLKRAASGHPDPRMTIVRDLCVSHIYLSDACLHALMDHLSPELRSIHFTHPHYSWNGTSYHPVWSKRRVSLSAKGLDAMLSHPNAARVEHINLDGAHLGQGCLDALRRAKLDSLTSISARYTNYQIKDFTNMSKKVAVMC